MLKIYASELSACIGLNRYCPVDDVAMKIWSRENLSSYKSAQLRNKKIEKKVITQELEDLEINDKVDEIIFSKPEEFAQKMQTIIESLGDKISQETTKDIRSFVHTERGKNSEEKSLNTMQVEMKQKINQRNTKFYKEYLRYDKGKKRVMIGGKVDGIAEDGTLIEMKNRQYKLFDKIPDYEMVQIHVYMYLTKMSKCNLIQCFRDENSQKIIEFDSDYWKEILRRLYIFSAEMEELFLDEKKQDKLLMMKEFSVNYKKDDVSCDSETITEDSDND